MIVRTSKTQKHALLDDKKNYVVLSIEVNSGVTFIRILAKDDLPRLFELDKFDIISGSFDSSWEVSVEGGRLCVGPPVWYRSGFWQSYFDGGTDEEKIFSEIAESILSKGSLKLR